MKISAKFEKKTMALGDLKRFIAQAEAAGCTDAASINILEGFKIRTLEAEMK